MCHRGNGHAVMFGDPDDSCGSKAVADIVIVPREGYDVSDIDFEEVASNLREQINEALTLLDGKRWDQYAAAKAEKDSEGLP